MGRERKVTFQVCRRECLWHHSYGGRKRKKNRETNVEQNTPQHQTKNPQKHDITVCCGVITPWWYCSRATAPESEDSTVPIQPVSPNTDYTAFYVFKLFKLYFLLLLWAYLLKWIGTFVYQYRLGFVYQYRLEVPDHQIIWYQTAQKERKNILVMIRERSFILIKTLASVTIHQKCCPQAKTG